MSFKVATLNLWHGLRPDSKIKFTYVEPPTRRKLRQQAQVEALKKIDADVYLLQEANPLGERSSELTQALNRIGFYQGDLGGVKLYNFGFPWNLNTGLLTLIREDWAPRQIGAWQLSGPPLAFTGSFYSLQFKECRYALAVEALHPDKGRVLFVNLHLHHSLEWRETYKSPLKAWFQKFEISESVQEELLKRLISGNQRRAKEIQKLLDRLAPLKNRYDCILLGGDLNCQMDSEEFQYFTEFGFRSQSEENAHSLSTWNPSQNENHRFQESFSPTVFIDDLTFSPTAQRELIQLIRTWENTPRQIDYLLVLASEKMKFDLWLFGENKESSNELPPSDHYGLVMKEA